ncbi:hypothetical protein [Brevibacillus fortis]|uniref:Uncharacterized protein n=1 Tax=Brevibacillus fortis TaxID=2126352 RepID=A0A2P7UVS9_9BACL|nr:hypothetical protein [Brevibacillus fortis]PSJ91081.1 hypothetical protein C7R93_20760 [Brevibacillus fortis]
MSDQVGKSVRLSRLGYDFIPWGEYDRYGNPAKWVFKGRPEQMELADNQEHGDGRDKIRRNQQKAFGGG